MKLAHRFPTKSGIATPNHRCKNTSAAQVLPIFFISSLLLCLTFGGCRKDEKHERYMSAKSGMEQEVSPGRNKTRHYEYLENELEKLGDYKDSGALYKEAVYRAGMAYLDEGNLYRARRQFSKAGDYKDASGRAMDASVTITNELIRNSSFSNFAGFFKELTNDQKDKNARAIQQFAMGKIEKLLAGEPDALEALSDTQRKYLQELREDTSSKPENIKKGYYDSVLRSDINSALDSNMRLLEVIKETMPVPVPDESKEKLYNEALRRIDEDHFWRPDRSFIRQERVMRILGLLGEYKNSKDLIRRCENAFKIPTIKAEGLADQAAKAGTHPQHRTISVAVAHDGKDQFVQGNFTGLCVKLKHRSAGSVYISDNIENACAIIYYNISHPFWTSFDYSGGTKAYYYHTNMAIELRATDGTVLYAKTFSREWDAPMKEIGGATIYGTNTTNMCAPINLDEELITELLKVLETHFEARQTAPE